MIPTVGIYTILHIEDREIPCRLIAYRREDGQERFGLYGDPWLSYQLSPGDRLMGERQYVVQEQALFQTHPDAEYDDPAEMVENMGTFLLLREVDEEL